MIREENYEYLGDIRGPQGREGRRGSQGLPGALALTNDALVAALLRTESETLAAVIELIGQSSVLSFGADPTGGTNTSRAIQDAIDASADTGMTTYVPKGIYRLDETLYMRHNGARLRAHPDAVFLRYHASSMILNGNVGQTIKGFDDVHVSGGTWDLRGDVNKTNGCVVSFCKAVGFSVSDMVMLNNWQSHNVELSGCSNGFVDNVSHKNYFTTDLVHEYCEMIQVEYVSAVGFPRFNIDDGTPCENIVISNNRQLPPDDPANKWGAGVGHHSFPPAGKPRTRNITIRNCDFGDCRYALVRPWGFENTIIESVNGTALYPFFLQGNDDGTYGVKITGCKVKSTGARAVRILNADAVSIDNCDIEGTIGVGIEGGSNIVIGPGNKIRSTVDDAVTIQANSSDVSRNTNGVTVFSNAMFAKRHGLQVTTNSLRTSRRVQIRDNQITADGASANLVGTSAISMSGNVIARYGAAYPVTDSGSNGVTIIGNTFPYSAAPSQGGGITNGKSPQYEVAANVFVG